MNPQTADMARLDPHDLRGCTPAEIDAMLFPILGKLADAEAKLTQMQESVERTLGEIELAKSEGHSAAYNENYVLPDLLDRLDKADEAIAFGNAQARPFEAEFSRRGGWVRYIVVPGGHLHRHGCHTLTPGRTMVGAVAEASGLDESDVVGRFGETACTHCFPDAPVAAAKTPAELGYCERSGTYAGNDLLDRMEFWKRGHGRIRCSCGESVALTSRGKLRKHKAPVK